jgi:hypothetical protein
MNDLKEENNPQDDQTEIQQYGDDDDDDDDDEETQQDDHEETFVIDGFELINNENAITTIYRNLYNDSPREIETQDDSMIFEEIFNDYNDIERIYEKEYFFLDCEKINNKYYIGIYSRVDDELLLGSCISSSSFFEFPINAVKKYLSTYSIIYNDRFFLKKIDILKLAINETDGTYNVIIKTVWLRIFQRKWKKLFAEKKSMMEHKKKLSSRMYFEVYGKWPPI